MVGTSQEVIRSLLLWARCFKGFVLSVLTSELLSKSRGTSMSSFCNFFIGLCEAESSSEDWEDSGLRLRGAGAESLLSDVLLTSDWLRLKRWISKIFLALGRGKSSSRLLNRCALLEAPLRNLQN